MRAKVHSCVEKRDKREASKKRDAEISWNVRVSSIIRKALGEVTKRACNQIGLDPVERVYIDHWAGWSDGSNEATRILAEVKRRTGVEMRADEDKNYINVVIPPGGWAPPEDNQLLREFSEALIEDDNRTKLWSKFLPQLADSLFTQIRTEFNQRRDKFYGIDDKITLMRLGNNYSSERREFKFFNLAILYSNLRQSQIDEITEAINAQISGGSVAIARSDISKDELIIHLLRTPEKVDAEAKPFWGYGEICAEYDGTTPELQELFNQIAAATVPYDTEEQINRLTPERKLLYMVTDDRGDSYSEQEWQKWHDCLERGNHREQLRRAVEKNFPGIQITNVQVLRESSKWASMRGCASGTRHYNQRIEFYYEITDPASSSELIANQLDAEHLIKHFRWRLYRYVAAVIAERMLTKAEEAASKGKLDELVGNDSWRGGMLTNENGCKDLIVELKGRFTGYSIDLGKVPYQAWLDCIAAEIKRGTKGLITSEFSDKSGSFSDRTYKYARFWLYD